MSTSFDDYLALCQLYDDYAIAVDSGNWDLWPEFFTDDCVYRLQPRENFERGFPLATLSFTSKGMLKDRVYGIKETLFHDPYYQRHVVGTPVVRSAEGGSFRCVADYAGFRTKLAIDKDFIMLSGEDGTALPFLAQGGIGCISVTSNVAPRLTAEMHKAWREGDLKHAMKINERLMPVNDAMFCETSPGPVKYAASLLGRASDELRLPLAPIAEASKQKVRAALTKAGLLN